VGQWDVHQNPVAKARNAIPYVVVAQSNLLAALPTRLVLPLSRSQVLPAELPTRMAPTFELLGEVLTLKPHQAGTLPVQSLGPVLASLADEWSVLVDALDAVISGV
jgi:toxin CcdB